MRRAYGEGPWASDDSTAFTALFEARALVMVLAGMIVRGCARVLAYFDDRLTNGILEGMSSVIRSAKRAARGFCDFEYFSTVTYLKLGKLPLVEQICATH